MKVLLVNGPPRAGKDEVAKTLRNADYKFVHEKFALPIRRATRAFFGLESDELLEQAKDNDPTIRQFMIGISERLAKPLLQRSYFGIACARRILETGTQRAVVTDAGFLAETAAFCEVLRMGLDNMIPQIQLWRIHRPGFDFAGDSREMVSLFGPETSIVDIQNNSGVEEYRQEILMRAWEFFGEDSVEEDENE